MATDYSKYGLPSGAYYDSGSGTVRDANGNDLGSPEMFGGTQPNGPTQDWSFPTQSYAVTPDYGQVQVVTGGTSQPNAGIGDFTTGAAALQAQNLTPGATSLEGAPTSFNDAQGNQQYFYGTPTLGGQTTFTDNPDSAWYKNSDLTPIQGIDSSGNLVSMSPTAATAIPSQYDTAQLNRSFLMGNAGVLAGMAGASALGPMLTGGSGATALPVAGSAAIPATELGGGALATTDVGSFLAADAAASAAGQGAFDVASALGMPLDQAVMAGLINGAGSLTDAGAAALMGGTASALPAGVTAADVAKYGSMAAKALSAAGALTNAAGAGSGTGLGSGTGSNASQQPYYNPNGPWNAAPVATNLTWAPHAQMPATAGDSNLAMLHPELAKQMALSGMLPTNLGGQQQQPQSQPYYTYGSPQQTTQPTAVAPVDTPDWTLGYANGGNVHIPEFITGATGHYVKGSGDGQADLIPAMLASGEFVWDADTVAALGNGDSDSGAEVLDGMRKAIRAHKRSAPIDSIPPKAKSPLQYMKDAEKYIQRDK